MIDHIFTVRRQDGIGPHPDDHPCAATVPTPGGGHVTCGQPKRDHETQPKPITTPEPAPPELWVAYNADGSGYAIFFTETEALRHALNLGMTGVEQINPGDITEEIDKARAQRNMTPKQRTEAELKRRGITA